MNDEQNRVDPGKALGQEILSLVYGELGVQACRPDQAVSALVTVLAMVLSDMPEPGRHTFVTTLMARLPDEIETLARSKP